jgi:flavorubredoxin
MYCVRNVTEDLYWVGADDRRLALFENFHPIPRGISYNSYLLLDEKTVLFDAADWSGSRQFLENVEHVLAGRPLDYVVVHHVEPDHGAALQALMRIYPAATVLCSLAGSRFLTQFGFAGGSKVETVKDGEQRCFGRHTLTFLAAPMVHWPEVLVSYDAQDGILFSADAFGTFGALNGKLFADEVDFDRDWLDDARRYYTNIVGKFGPSVQDLLKKAAGLDIRMICPLHGPVWRKDLAYYLSKYDLWSRYAPEVQGVLIVYGSMYGGTENAANILAARLAERGVTATALYDVSAQPVSVLVSETFKYSHLAVACVTYNLGIFPPMLDYLEDLAALHVRGRTAAVVECGTWAIKSGGLIREKLAALEDMRLLEPGITVRSALQDAQSAQLDALADALAADLR